MKVRGWRTIYHVNGHQKKVGVAILLSDKLDFNVYLFTRETESKWGRSERGGDRGSKVGSALTAASPMQGSNSETEIMT